METKEMILEAALNLFSQKGYDASSVRDIAARIGIKDSSLYFHYKNKQAILDALMNQFITISEQMMAIMDNNIESITSMEDTTFYAVTERYVESYFMNDFICRFIMVMNHERSHNEQLRDCYIKWCIEKPIEFQSQMIAKLQAIGYLKKLDTQYITLEYYAPIFLFFNQYMNQNHMNQQAFKKAVLIASEKFIQIFKENK